MSTGRAENAAVKKNLLGHGLGRRWQHVLRNCVVHIYLRYG